MPPAFDPRGASFVFSYDQNAQGGDTTVMIADTAYRVNRLGRAVDGTLEQPQLDTFIAQLEAADVWSLDGREEWEQRTCRANTTVEVRLGARTHCVSFYGTPNERVEGFTAMLSQGLVEQLLQAAGKPDPRKAFDAHLRCPGCPTLAHVTGSTTCLRHGTGLMRWKLPPEERRKPGASAYEGMVWLAMLELGSPADRATSERMLRVVVHRCASCDGGVDAAALRCDGCGQAFAQR